jgi:3-oxoacyl-[acyl-carrier-protein] synthase-1
MRATQIEDWSNIPLLLCVAEPERPGRLDGLDVALLADVQFEVGVDFAVTSSIIPEGRASVASALRKARAMMTSPSAQLVVVAATDSLLTWQTLSSYARADRLLTPRNSNGFMAGEGACALLLGSAPIGNQLLVCGVGTAKEASPIDMEKPLRGDGLTNAVRQALNEADCELHDLDFRITDVSGEQYYFKEAALALSRILRTHKETFELWQPSECIGETGAVAGLSLIAVAEAACRKAYAPGRGILCHAANDSGQRAAIVLRYTES